MKYKTKSAWYNSPEHFKTEKSWEAYKIAQKRKRAKKQFSYNLPF